MARKNLLTGITNPGGSTDAHETRADYALRGASRSMKLSIDELAESAKKIVAGETVIELDPALVDPSPVKDRIDDDQEEFALFRDGIEERGQLQPILVRPNPQASGRYIIVFGHRRARAAKELGRPVRAIVKNVDEVTHVVAQGQENTRRKDYSFIEKALFARKLLDLGHSKDVAKAALSVDDTLLSRMLSITEIVPISVIDAVGAARTVGRDRWEELKKLLNLPKNRDRATDIIRSDEFIAGESVVRFNVLLANLKSARKWAGRHDRPTKPIAWTAHDQHVTAQYRNTGRSFSLSLSAKDAGAFGKYISSNLEALYRAFREAETGNQTGD